MKLPDPAATWPESWHLSWRHDVNEVGEGPAPRRFLGHRLSYRKRLASVLGLLAKAVPAPARILDLAAAQGNFSLYLAKKGYAVTWNDLREELEGYVRQKADLAGLSLTYRPGNILSVDPKTLEPFDAVLAGEVLEHVAHPDRFMQSIAHLVKPGGYLILTTPNGGYFLNRLPRFSDHPDPSVFEQAQFKPDSDGHIFLLHEDELRSLSQKAGLTVEKLVLFGNPLTQGHVKTSYLLALLPKSLVLALDALTSALPGFLRRKLSASAVLLLRKPL